MGPALGRLHPNLLVTSTATKKVSTAGTISGHAERRVRAMGYSQRIDAPWCCQRPNHPAVRRPSVPRRRVHARVGVGAKTDRIGIDWVETLDSMTASFSLRQTVRGHRIAGDAFAGTNANTVGVSHTTPNSRAWQVPILSVVGGPRRRLSFAVWVTPDTPKATPRGRPGQCTQSSTHGSRDAWDVTLRARSWIDASLFADRPAVRSRGPRMRRTLFGVTSPPRASTTRP